MYIFLYSHYKSIGYVWRGIKTISRPQNLYYAGQRPPVLKLMDPPQVLFFQSIDNIGMIKQIEKVTCLLAILPNELVYISRFLNLV